MKVEASRGRKFDPVVPLLPTSQARAALVRARSNRRGGWCAARRENSRTAFARRICPQAISKWTSEAWRVSGKRARSSSRAFCSAGIHSSPRHGSRSYSSPSANRPARGVFDFAPRRNCFLVLLLVFFIVHAATASPSARQPWRSCVAARRKRERFSHRIREPRRRARGQWCAGLPSRRAFAQFIGAAENIRPPDGRVNEHTVAQIVVNLAESRSLFRGRNIPASYCNAQGVSRFDAMQRSEVQNFCGSLHVSCGFIAPCVAGNERNKKARIRVRGRFHRRSIA